MIMDEKLYVGRYIELIQEELCMEDRDKLDQESKQIFS